MGGTRASRLVLRAVPWVAAWVVLTSIALTAHHAAWHGDGSLGPFGERATKTVSNVMHVMSAPGFAVARRVIGGWGIGWPWGPALALGIGSACAVGGAWIVIAAWRALRRWLASDTERSRTVGFIRSRRRLLVDAPFAVAVAAPSAALGVSTLVAPTALTTRRHTIEIEDLPESLDGLRIAQVSDTHLGPRVPMGFVEEAVERVSRERPDLIALTGDYIHAGLGEIDRATRAFAPLVDPGVAPMGVLAVLGNHEYYGDAAAVAAGLRSTGVRVLINERVFVDAASRALVDREPASGLCIAGVDDFDEGQPRAGVALARVRWETPRVVLSHHPDYAEAQVFETVRADLMLSGHTHGGQVRVPGVGAPFTPSRYGEKYARPLVRGPRFPVVVSFGVGMSLLPVRFNAAPDVTVVTLRRASGG